MGRMQLQPGDYYLEDGKYVFTEQFLLRRGYCCDNGCRHCPYKRCGSSAVERIADNDEVGGSTPPRTTDEHGRFLPD